MNNPKTTIQEFADRLTDLSFITPLFTLRPPVAHAELTHPPPNLPTPTTLHTLVETITSALAESQLPLDPTLPLLQTPDKTPLKATRPRADAAPLVPKDNTTNDFSAFLSAQVEHLQRLSHYNYQVLELRPGKRVTHSANDFCKEVVSLLPDREAFKERFSVYPTSPETVSLISALKTGREVVVPIGEVVFVHVRGVGEKVKTRNDVELRQMFLSISSDNGVWYRKFRIMSVIAWFVVLAWVVLVIGVGVWNEDDRSVVRALLDSANVLQLGAILTIMALGVGKEFWTRFGLLVGWRRWGCEKDILRDIGESGRDCLVAGLLSGGLVDHVVTSFGIGVGDVRLREWTYDPRFGLVVGEKNAFCVRDRRWFRVERIVEGVKEEKIFRYRLYATGARKAFVGVDAGVVVIDGGKVMEVV